MSASSADDDIENTGDSPVSAATVSALMYARRSKASLFDVMLRGASRLGASLQSAVFASIVHCVAGSLLFQQQADDCCLVGYLGKALVGSSS
ncbi:hypothetical protein LSAT2_007819 [Lamellibrachia satsuma]|nr:hypothetical protein LSAT2_007819 [Lamellibrachia satsuma]